MDKVYEVFNMELEILTPLHIGDGSSLLSMEYIFHQNKLYVVKLEWILNNYPDFVDRIPEGIFYLGERLTDSQRTVETLVINLEGEKGAERVMRVLVKDFLPGRCQEIHTFIKDLNSRPYIPGSSIKGALRTAAAFALVKKGKPYRDVEDLFREKEEGGGFDDVFKAIGVSDALPKEPDDGVLQVVKSQRIGSRRKLINYWEIVPPGRKFTFTIKIHLGHSFAGKWFEKTGLGSDPETIVRELLGASNLFSQAVLASEQESLGEVKNKILKDRKGKLYDNRENKASQRSLYNLVESFYNSGMLQIPTSSGEAILSMARGTGRHRKTVRLAGYNWQNFMPKTREVISATEYQDKPVFGWVKLRRVD
ncbi:MAG: type III-A CRISPR-associated RAMP protein Csm5 [candidate division WOR-3 bacterium]